MYMYIYIHTHPYIQTHTHNMYNTILKHRNLTMVLRII